MNRQQLCDEWHIPYFPTVEEFDELDNRGDFEYHMEKEASDDAHDPVK